MENNKHLEDIFQIRSMMERSTTFLSLSGLSGVVAGVWAVIGAGFAYWYMRIYYPEASESLIMKHYHISFERLFLMFADAIAVLGLALISGFYFTWRNTKRKGLTMWNVTSKRLFFNLMLPLVTGGFFVIILFLHRDYGYIAPAMLLFYGLALVNAAKYTVHDIRWLGISEIILGLASALFMGYGLMFWAIGFGLLHIIYGSAMYYKYERNSSGN